jgi:hypothetical protein
MQTSENPLFKFVLDSVDQVIRSNTSISFPGSLNVYDSTTAAKLIRFSLSTIKDMQSSNSAEFFSRALSIAIGVGLPELMIDLLSYVVKNMPFPAHVTLSEAAHSHLKQWLSLCAEHNLNPPKLVAYSSFSVPMASLEKPLSVCADPSCEYVFVLYATIGLIKLGTGSSSAHNQTDLRHPFASENKSESSQLRPPSRLSGSVAGHLYAHNNLIGLLARESVDSCRIRVVSLKSGELSVLFSSDALISGCTLLHFNTLLPLADAIPELIKSVPASIPELIMNTLPLSAEENLESKIDKAPAASSSHNILRFIGVHCEGSSSLPAAALPIKIDFAIDMSSMSLWGHLTMQDGSIRSCTGFITSKDPLAACKCSSTTFSVCYYLSFSFSFNIDSSIISRKVMSPLLPASSPLLKGINSLTIMCQTRIRVKTLNTSDSAPKLVAGDTFVVEYFYANQIREKARFMVRNKLFQNVFPSDYFRVKISLL